MRKHLLTFRVSRQELDDFFNYAHARGHNVSYFIREALKDAYPEVFSRANRYIRKPRKRIKPMPEKTQVMVSYVDGSVKIVDDETTE